MNNPWVQGLADDIAANMGRVHRQPGMRCRLLFETLFGRVPMPEEVQESLALVAAVRGEESAAADPLSGWKTLVHTLLLSSEFIYVH